MFPRTIQPLIKTYSEQYRCIALVGPRQSGKTTLARATFPDHLYLSLENPDTRRRATDDPRTFLASSDRDLIIDEIQYAPELFSYLQEHLDNPTTRRQFILTGSNSFQLNARISQSLAGRVRLLTILPCFREELPLSRQPGTLNESLYKGGYPRIYDEGLDPYDWFADYYNTYVQKDVRALLQVENLSQFDRFVRITAGRVGQLSNYSSISSEVAVEQPTIRRWMGVLEASFLIFRLEPHYRNFNKRIIKSPKFYFYDTGLLCYLLRIQTADQLDSHPLRGEIFENWVIAEMAKASAALAKNPPFYFWRDQHGHEIDLIVDKSSVLEPVEIKSGATFRADWLANATWFNALQHHDRSVVVYGGAEQFVHKEASVVPWRNLFHSIKPLL